jgi:alpha-beta hydrolase superfamily lysophospholipase
MARTALDFESRTLCEATMTMPHAPEEMRSDHEIATGWNRRDLLRASLVAGGSALAGVGLAACGSAAPAAPPTHPPRSLPDLSVPTTAVTADPDTGVRLFEADDLNFQTLFTLGAAGAGTADVGEVIATVDQINAAGASYETYYDAFVSMAQSVGGTAAQDLKAGHLISARSAYLRSASYYDAALYFVLGTSQPDREEATYRAMQQQWDTAAQLFEPAFERVAIPYQGTSLPGYFMKPDNSGKARPTVIVTNGSDAQFVDTFAYGGQAAIERGYNALLYEGPGQGSMLFERQIAVRPDWEKVVTPIVDYLGTRSDVDSSRIAMTGWSMGGNLVPRAAAFEHRLAAVVADPGLPNLWLAYPSDFRGLFPPDATASQVNSTWQTFAIPSLSPLEVFTVKKRSELMNREFLLQARAGEVPTNAYLLGTTVMSYTIDDVIPRITSPTLVVEYQMDDLVPAGEAQNLYDALRSQKDLVTLTVAEGAEYHCAPMAPQRRNQVVFDWLDRTLDV